MIEEWILSRGPETALIVLSLGAARPLAFVMVTPLFTRFGLQSGLIRAGILSAFAGPVVYSLYGELLIQEAPAISFLIILLVKELTIGLLLALVLGVPLWAVAAAGDMIDLQRGASMASMVDPGSGDDTTPTGTLFFLLVALVLASSDWVRDVLLDSLYGTYTIWPVLSPLPSFDAAAGAGVLGLLDDLIETGLVLSIPLFGAMFLTEITMAIAGKYVQQLNVMFIAMSAKQVVYALLLPLYFSALLYYMRGEIADLTGATGVLESLLTKPEAPPNER